MLNNNDIIAKLTDSQKIRILTDVGSLSGTDFRIMGLCGAGLKNIKDYGRSVFPRASAMSHSWDEQLWGRVSEARARLAAADGAETVIVPGPKIKFSPYRREITEDPFLASVLSSSGAAAVRSIGMRAALSGFYLTESDVAWMDKEPSERIVNEFFGAPYESAAETSDAVITDIRSLPSEYRSASAKAQDAIAANKYLICEAASEENTVDFISRGIICLSASQNALEAAMSRYKKLKGSMDKGEGITPEQILSEENNNRAISDETVDRALDRVIDFLREKGKCAAAEADADYSELGLEAAQDSAVLLKNSFGILPLEKHKGIALVGGKPQADEDGGMLPVLRDKLLERGYRSVSAVAGFDPDEIQNGAVCEKALRAVDSVSIVVLFLGFDDASERRLHRTGTLELPPNQLKLADLLTKRKKTVIGIIASGHSPDIEFTRKFGALMIAPLGVESSAEAMARLLSGEVSPSGKLAYTLYAGSRTAFAKRELYKRKYGIKSGPFIGYRYYDTAKINVGYPFGHGLSYAKFEYSAISYSGGTVSFAVKNVGNVTASEVAQVYIGADSKKVLRPEKELCGFAKVRLEPQEKKVIKLRIKIPEVYISGAFKTEGSTYDIFVGASSDDIRLSTKAEVLGAALRSDGELIRNYIQSSSNVIEDNYTLEAKYCPMKKRSLKNIIIGFCLLAIAASLAVFNTAMDISSVFLGVVASILAIFAVVFLVADMLDRSRSYEDDLERINAKNQEQFAEAEQLQMLSTDKMFNDEFDAHNDEEYADVSADDDSDDDIGDYIDGEFKLADLAAELAAFAENRGIKLDAESADILAVSLASSRMILLDGIGAEEFNSLSLILSEYFASSAYVDTVDETVKDTYSLFFNNDSNGDHMKRASAYALEAAADSKEKVQILAVNGVDAESFEFLSKPFETYITSPKDKNEIRIYNEHGVNVGYNIPKNLRILVRLTDHTPVDTLPVSVMRMISYNRISAVKSLKGEEHPEYHGCNRYQLEHIYKSESSADAISDKIFAKIDDLEKYASSHSGYKIGNKLWLAFEKYVGLLLSTGKEVGQAADVAIANKLLPSMAAALRGRLSSDDETLKGTVDFIFGDEGAAACSKFITVLNEKNERLAEYEAELAKAAEAEAHENNAEVSENVDEADGSAAAAEENVEASVANTASAPATDFDNNGDEAEVKAADKTSEETSDAMLADAENTAEEATAEVTDFSQQAEEADSNSYSTDPHNTDDSQE